jgi:hypothetical protein
MGVRVPREGGTKRKTWITVPEAMRLFHIKSKTTVYSYVREKKVRSRKISAEGSDIEVHLGDMYRASGIDTVGVFVRLSARHMEALRRLCYDENMTIDAKLGMLAYDAVKGSRHGYMLDDAYTLDTTDDSAETT